MIGRLKYPDLLSEQSRNEFRSRFKFEIDEYQTKGYVNGLEFEFMRKDRTIFPVLVNATALFDENGRFLKSRTTVFNNAARKAAEEKAEQLRKEMEAFTYSVSHDLRAPLRFIGGYAQMLEEDYREKLDAEGNRLIGTIQKNAERMGQLIDDLLDFSRMGRKELMMAIINHDQLVKEVLEEFQLKKMTNQIDVVHHPLGNLRADRSMLKQVWINLISNAIKYSRKQQLSKVEIGRIDTSFIQSILSLIIDSQATVVEIKDTLILNSRRHQLNSFTTPVIKDLMFSTPIGFIEWILNLKPSGSFKSSSSISLINQLMKTILVSSPPRS